MGNNLLKTMIAMIYKNKNKIKIKIMSKFVICNISHYIYVNYNFDMNAGNNLN